LALICLVFSSIAQAQDPCVATVLSKLPADAITVLTDCFGNVSYSYNPSTCALMSRAALYCDDAPCEQYMIQAIGTAFEENCTTQVLQSLEATSPYICDPANQRLCPAGQACISPAVNATTYYCAPIYANASCTGASLGQPCSPCTAGATVCTVDLQNSFAPTCIVIAQRTVDIFNDALTDVYYYLGQTYCQKKAGGSFCSDYVYAKPAPLMTCADVDTWGCCGGTYFDLATYCENPAIDVVENLKTMCTNSTSWMMNCGGAKADKCCAVSNPCNLGAAAGVVPSLFLISILAFMKLVV